MPTGAVRRTRSEVSRLRTTSTERPRTFTDPDDAVVPVSVIVLTLNEERNIADCLASLRRFAEVFVVDSGSTDRTCEIAEELGAKVVPFTWDGGYPKKKQWCLDTLPFANDWVMYVDADERMTSELATEIAARMQGPNDHAGYFVSLESVFMGRAMRHGHRVFRLGLFDRHKGRFVDYDDLDARKMWEVEGHYQPVIAGRTAVLRGRLIHYDYDPFFHWIDRHNRYSDWEALLRSRGELPRPEETQPGRRGWLKATFNQLPCKGLVAFLWSYVLRAGFLDGRAGLHFALARGFYYWQMGQKMREYERRTRSEP